MAQLDNNLFRLRVELSDSVAMFSFLYFQNKYNILTYTFLPMESKESILFKTIGGWKEVGRERAKPIIELGMQKYQEMMQNFEAEPNY